MRTRRSSLSSASTGAWASKSRHSFPSASATQLTPVTTA
jgi:hypothetical protein